MSKICIVGMGNMGGAIFEALKGDFEVVGADKGDDVSEVAGSCDVVILAVKPQDFGSLGLDLNGKLVISIMAGVSLEKLSRGLGADRVVRVMPNLPLKVGKALSGWACSVGVGEEDKEFVRKILLSFGEEIYVEDENKIDAITALSGSGPAYFYKLAEEISEVAKRRGFSEEEAKKIGRACLVGSAELVEKLGEDVGTLREKITSKGGTTEAALAAMESGGFGEVVEKAVDAAYKRSKELNN